MCEGLSEVLRKLKLHDKFDLNLNACDRLPSLRRSKPSPNRMHTPWERFNDKILVDIPMPSKEDLLLDMLRADDRFWVTDIT